MRMRDNPAWSWLRQAHCPVPVWCVCFLVYLETVFILGLFGRLEWHGYLVCLAFSGAGGCLVALPALFFRPAIRKAVLLVLCAGLTVLFLAQVVYYSLFTTFFSLYSMSAGGGQVMQFWPSIVDTILRNWLLILILLLPLLFLVFQAVRRLDWQPVRLVGKGKVAGLALAFYLAGLALLQLPGPQYYTPRQLYGPIFSSALGVSEFGLLTTLRLDLRRILFGSGDLATVNAAVSLDVSPASSQAKANPAAIEAGNQLQIDFAARAAQSSDPAVQALHRYFQTVAPTPKNAYTGRFRGKNLILVVAESFTPYAVRQDITPTLYKLCQEGMRGTNFYTPIWPVSTSDGEYTANLSLIPRDDTWSMTASAGIDLPFTMGRLLLNRGYRTLAYHDHVYTFYQRYRSHPNLGYQSFKAVGSGLAITSQWPESDLEMIEASAGDYLGQSPFAVYYMTVSGHLEYSMNNAMVRKNWSTVADLPYSTAVRSYLACNVELDRALAALIARLEAAGQAEDTVIALCADHYPYGLSRRQINELAGRTLEPNFELFKNSFVIWHAGIQPLEITVPGCNLDILPTLANLFGLEYDSRLLMGRDLLADADHLVIFANRSWLNAQGTFNALTGVFTPWPGQTAPDSTAIRRICRQVDGRFASSSLILGVNYYASLGSGGG